MRTNNTTLQLPLLITKTNITLLLGLDWMKRLRITLNAATDSIKKHNIKLEDVGKNILKPQEEFKDLFYNNTEIKNIFVKINLIENANIKQQKRRAFLIYLQDQVAEENKRLIKRFFGKSNRNNGDCFVSAAVMTMKNDKSN